MSKIPFLHIACFKWGTSYPSQEVNILKAMVDRNLSVPHEFHCITDDRKGLDEDIIIHDLPTGEVAGFNKKLFAYSNDFLGLNGEFVVLMDIDLVVVGSLDFLADDPEKDFLVVEDFGKPGLTHTAVFRIKVGSCNHVWENYIRDPVEADNICPERADRDQFWLEYQIEKLDFFPKNKIVSFKYHCNPEAPRLFGKTGARLGLTLSHFGEAHPPKDAAIVSFHGVPLPRDVVDKRYLHYRRAPFVREHWHE